jgi:hypothetical protein
MERIISQRKKEKKEVERTIKEYRQQVDEIDPTNL